MYKLMTFASMFCCDGGARYTENLSLMESNGSNNIEPLEKDDFEIYSV